MPPPALPRTSRASRGGHVGNGAGNVPGRERMAQDRAAATTGAAEGESHAVERALRLEVLAGLQYRSSLLKSAWIALRRHWARNVVVTRSKEVAAIRAWSRRVKVKAVQAWKMWMGIRQQNAGKTVVAIRFWAVRIMSKAFRKMALAAKHGRIRGLKARRLQKGAWQRRKLETIAYGWGLWKRQALRKIRAAEGHYVIKLFRVCFDKWVAFYRRRRSKRQKYERVARLADEKLLLCILSEWQALPRTRVKAMKLARQEKLEAFTVNRDFKFVLARLKRYAIRQKAKRRNDLLAIYFRWLVLVKGTFSVWVSKCQQRLEKHRRLRKAEKVGVRIKLREAFKRIKIGCEILRDRKEANLLALRHWAMSLSSACFIRWSVFCLDKIHLKEKINRCQSHLSFRKKIIAMLNLRHHADRSRGTKRRDKMVSTFHRTWILRHGFSSLRAKTLVLLQAKQREALSAKFYKQSLLSKVFRSLCRGVALLTTEREEMIALADMFYREKVLKAQKRAAIAFLRDHCSLQKSRADINTIAAHFYRKNKMKYGIDLLQTWTYQQRASSVKQLVARTHALRSLIKRCFSKWKEYHIGWQNLVAKLYQAEQHNQRRLLCTFFSAWCNYLGICREKRNLADRAMRWRHDFLIRRGTHAWLSAAMAEKASIARALREREAAKAESLAKRVANIAFHWRDLTLRRQLRKKGDGKAFSQTQQFDTRTSRRALLSPPASSQAWSYEARVQAHTSLNLDWLDRLSPPGSSGDIIPASRPAPRKPIDLLLPSDENVSSSAPMINPNPQARPAIPGLEPQREFQSSFQTPSQPYLRRSTVLSIGSDQSHNLRASGLGLSTCSEAEIRSKLLEFSSLKHQVTEDRRKKDFIRRRLKTMRRSGQFDSEEHSETVRQFVEILADIQERKDQYDSLRAQVLPLMRSLLSSQAA